MDTPETILSNAVTDPDCPTHIIQLTSTLLRNTIIQKKLKKEINGVFPTLDTDMRTSSASSIYIRINKGREELFNGLDGISAFSAEHGHDEIRRDAASAAVVGVATARGVIGVDVEGECDDCVSFFKLALLVVLVRVEWTNELHRANSARVRLTFQYT